MSICPYSPPPTYEMSITLLILLLQYLYCYTSKAEDLVKLLSEAGLIASEQKWIMLGKFHAL